MISVCIATYNGEKYIREQLFSILQELGDNDEVVISDDGSTDNTISIINAFHDERIKIFHHERGQYKYKIDNSTHNFENALLNSNGDYILLSDQDDVWVKGRVKLMIDMLQQYDLVVGDCSITDECMNILTQSYYNEVKSFNVGILQNILHSSFLGCTMAFSRKVLEKALPFPKSGVAHDLWIGLVAIKYFKISRLNSPVTYYRRHSNTVTPSKKNKHTILFMISYRLCIIQSVFKRLLF